MALGGADVSRGEPDLRFLYHREQLGVAIKRVKSLQERTLRDEMRDAAKQIRDSTGRGVIALNLDSWIGQLKTEGEVGELGADFAKQISAAHSLLFDMSDKAAIAGAFFIATWVNWDLSAQRPRLGFHVPRQIKLFTATEEDVLKAREFFDPFSERVTNGVREILQYVSRPAA